MFDQILKGSIRQQRKIWHSQNKQGTIDSTELIDVNQFALQVLKMLSSYYHGQVEASCSYVF